MTLTKQQDALATKLRDAGVPGAFAVLVASRAEPPLEKCASAIRRELLGTNQGAT